MPTELAEGSLPKCTIARGDGEIRTSGYPLPTPLYTFFAPPVHSPNLTTHPLKPLSAQDTPLKPCIRQLAGAPSWAGGHEATLLPCRSNGVGAGRWAQ